MSAVASAWLATTVRRAAASRGVPDVAPALAEDAVVVVLGALTRRRLQALIQSRASSKA